MTVSARPDMTCRKCAALNPVVYLAPIVIEAFHSSCVCFDCAKVRGWLDADGNLKPGIYL